AKQLAATDSVRVSKGSSFPHPPDSMKGGQTKSEATSTDQRLKTRGRKKKTTTNKDPNKPKRPPSAFFVFLDDFRREFNEAITNLCTNNLISQVGKAAGAKWKSMSEEEKAPYASKAESRKSEYLKSMQHESGIIIIILSH
ncbi:unnamed protein product, partial [Brassica oleracea]